MRRPLLFYADWPLDYHNQEAAHKARAFAAAGYDTVYVTGAGIRNPRPASLRKAADRLRRKLTDEEQESGGRSDGVRTATLLVAPPRQLPPVRRANAAWARRQLRAALGGPGGVAWIRIPSPELVDVLDDLAPAAVVYECLDAYHHTPGITGRWARRFDAAERALVARADAVVVPGEHLADRFRAWGAQPIVLPHGVDLSRFPLADPATPSREPVLGFVGTLDFRLDVTLIRHLAERRPAWRVRLVGPVHDGFDPREIADLANVTVEPAVPYAQVGALLATFDVCLMPYADIPVFHAMTPVKATEVMAVGKPAIVRRSRALEPDGDLLYFASGPDEFVEQAERALAEDGPARAAARRRRAEQHELGARMDRYAAVPASLGAPPTA